MATTTWVGLYLALAVLIGAFFFFVGVLRGNFRSIESFRKWTLFTALFAGALMIFAAVPIDRQFPCAPSQSGVCNAWLRDLTSEANALGPILLSISLFLTSVFYAGEWYAKFQHFRVLGIDDAKANRLGRQTERAVFWQDLLMNTKVRIVISGVTLGGWFSYFEETRQNLLAILPQAEVQILLERPGCAGFVMRADDPGEMEETPATERARPRAKQVYLRIAGILDDPAFKAHLDNGKLTFYTYDLTPLSVVWSDDQIIFTPYLPAVSDRACPEFTVSRNSQIGEGLVRSIESLLKRATKISSAQDARVLADRCEEGLLG